jgi:transposase
MARPYSTDLRERVVAAVERDGMSRNEAAALFGVAVSTAINWVARMRRTGSVAAGQMGGHKPRTLSGAHRDWLVERCRTGDFTLRGLVAELAERGVKIDYHSVWDFVHAEKLSFKKLFTPANRIVQTWCAGAHSGIAIRRGLSSNGWPSSTRPGPRVSLRRGPPSADAGLEGGSSPL